MEYEWFINKKDGMVYKRLDNYLCKMIMAPDAPGYVAEHNRDVRELLGKIRRLEEDMWNQAWFNYGYTKE